MAAGPTTRADNHDAKSALFDALIVAEGTGLAKKLIDKRGLAMVDVRDDRDITQGHELPLELSFPAGAAPDQSIARAPTGNDALRQGARRRRICIGMDVAPYSRLKRNCYSHI